MRTIWILLDSSQWKNQYYIHHIHKRFTVLFFVSFNGNGNTKKKINFAWNWNSHFANFSATQTQQYREIHSRKLCDSFFIARLLFVSAQSWSNTLDWSNVWHESEQTTRKRYIACKIHPRSILAILHVKADLFRIFAFFSSCCCCWWWWSRCCCSTFQTVTKLNKIICDDKVLAQIQHYPFSIDCVLHI